MEQRLGNYYLTRLLGRGGFADVYYGEHLYLKTAAAIKTLRLKITRVEQEKFLAEAQIAARLEHPHIIAVLEFGVEHTIPYLVMDYAANGTLRQQYPKGVQLTTKQIWPVVEQVASALDYTHQQHLIHRDVKPENMLLNSEHDILLSDFGIALVVQNTRPFDAQRHVVGTMAYMAPEQLRGEPSPASDQYSLAAVIYEWLCGEQPFTGSYTEMAIQHALVPPVPLCKRVPHLSSEVEEVIMIALAKDPQARFKSIKAFANAFGQACTVEQDGTAAERGDDASLHHDALEVVTEAHAPRRHSRRTFAVGLSLLGGIGLLAGGTLAWKFLLQRSQFPFFIKRPTQVLHLTPTPTIPLPGTTLVIYHGQMLIGNIAWSRDSKRIASASDNVQIWDATTAKLILMRSPPPDLSLYSVPAMAWSPDSRWIALAYTNYSSPINGQLEVWDANTGNTLYTYSQIEDIGGGVQEGGISLAWSPESQRIAVVTGRALQVRQATTGDLLTTYSGHTSRITGLAWSPDGKYIVSAEEGTFEADRGTVHIWDAVTGQNQLIYREHADSVNTVAWSPDGQHIVSAGGEKVADPSQKGDNTVRIWESVSGKTQQSYSEHSGIVTTAVWSPDSKYIASGDSYSSDVSVKIWDAATGQSLLTYRGHTHRTLVDRIVALAWSPNGKLIVSGGGDGTIQVWKAI